MLTNTFNLECLIIRECECRHYDLNWTFKVFLLDMNHGYYGVIIKQLTDNGYWRESKRDIFDDATLALDYFKKCCV